MLLKPQYFRPNWNRDDDNDNDNEDKAWSYTRPFFTQVLICKIYTQ